MPDRVAALTGAGTSKLLDEQAMQAMLDAGVPEDKARKLLDMAREAGRAMSQIEILDFRDALEAVAKAVAAAALRGRTQPEWANYPEICERDWEAIECWLESHADTLDVEIAEFDRAYELLAGRADPNAC